MTTATDDSTTRQPLTEWDCDVCHEPITDPTMALLAWRFEDAVKSDFRIVHKGRCDRDRDDMTIVLDDAIGALGFAWLTSFLSYGPINHGDSTPRIGDMNNFVDVFRRLQVPWYEEARPYFRSEAVQDLYSDANEVIPGIPDELKRIYELGVENE
jgi:hypothetical protein